MVTLIVTTNEAYLGWIMYLALQMQPSIHLPRQMSHCIRSRGRGRLFPFCRTTGVEKQVLRNPSAERTSSAAQGRDFVEMLPGDNSPPHRSRELLKDQRLQHLHCRTCSRAGTSPPFRHPPYTISSYNSHQGGRSGAREVAEGCGSAMALPWTSPLLPSLLPAGFLGTLLELRTNCNYFPR